MKLISARRIYVDPAIDRDPLSITNQLFCGWCVRDRFDLLNATSNFRFAEGADPIPTPLEDGLKLADLMNAKASELIQKANGQTIGVSWSGGVDSTAVISALLKNGLPTSRLHVFFTKDSVQEYELFYRFMREQNIRMTIKQELIKELKAADCAFIVSGWCADQLFGSNIHLRDPKLYNEPWVDGMRVAFKERGMRISAAGIEKLEAVWQNYAKTLGLELKQFCEFAWLYNFGIKFSYVRDEAMLALAGSKNQHKTEPFFAGIDFQRWSVRRFDHIKEHNVNLLNKFYKRPLKRYIYDFNNDPDYFNCKGKKNSWAMVGEDMATVNVLTDEGVRLYRHLGSNYGSLSREIGNRFRKIVK